MTKTFKHSGVEWLGEIPSHWEVRKIKFATKEIISGGTPKTSNLNFWSDDLNSNSYLWVAIEDMTNAEFIEMTDKFITKQGLENSSAKIVPPFTILYSIYASLGKIAYSDKCLTTNQAILGLVTKESYFYKYCFYSLMSLTPTLVALSNKTTQDNINLDILKNIKIPLPPLDEQRKVAEFLDEKCGKIAEFIAKKQALIALLKERKKALINEAVCGRLDLSQNELCESGTKSPPPLRRGVWGVGEKAHENGVNLNENSQNSVNSLSNSAQNSQNSQNENFADAKSTHPQTPSAREGDLSVAPLARGALNSPCEFKRSGVEWLGEIPHHWEVRKLKTFAKVVLGKMLCSEEKKGYTCEHYLKSKNIQWLSVDISSVDKMYFSEYEKKLYRIQKDDLLVSEGGEVGKTCIWNDELKECYLQNSVHKITFDKTCNPRYFLYLFFACGKMGGFDSAVSRVSIAHLTWDILVNIKFIKPPKNEQQKIAEFLDKKCAELDRACALIQAQIEAMREYKSSLIDSAVRGKLDV